MGSHWSMFANKGRKGMRIVFFGLIILAVTLPSAAQWTSYDVDLPSVAAGGGTLALRVFEPVTTRYPEGAPVLVWVTGGTSWGSLANPLQQADGIVLITFLMPGGSDGVRSSDGVWDDRGTDSILALRDVVRYAGGVLNDDGGLALHNILTVTPLEDQVGLLGSSNGGNLVIVAPSLYGADMNGILRWVVQWESPVSSQAAVSDNSKVSLSDCPVGVSERVGTNNPRYLAYGPLELTIDFSDLTYSPSDPYSQVMHDGTGDGGYSTVLDSVTGCQTPDLDFDGELALDEDYPLMTFTDGSNRVFSRPVTQALHDLGLFGGSWPADIHDLAEATSYWYVREAVRHYQGAVASLPNLEGMVLSSVEDHVQGDPGRFHIRQAFEGWHETGAWVRINPGPEYVLEVEPALLDPLPDNTPNTPPLDWYSPLYTYPETVANGIVQTASVFEMADRAHSVIFRDGFETGDLARWSAEVR